MAELIKKDVVFTDYAVGEVKSLGSTDGRTIFMNTIGSGHITSDSTWELVQSSDNANWTTIVGGGWTANNAKQTVELIEKLNAVYLGVRKIANGTETTGTTTIYISIK